MTKCPLRLPEEGVGFEWGECNWLELSQGNDFSNRGSEAGFLFEMLLITHETLAMQFAAESDKKYAEHMGHVAQDEVSPVLELSQRLGL